MNAQPRRLRAHGWATLLPVVMLVCILYWGVRPWTLTAVVAAVAVTWLAPALAADLAAVGLIGFASCAFALAQRGSVTPPGSGTTAGYPLHTLLFTHAMPNAFDLTAGLAMLAFGVWLVPRTLGVDSGLAKRNRELRARVRRLTVTRVDAVDTAAAELRRVERDLHDGAQARLIALGISLRATEGLIRTNPEAAVALVVESRENSARALAELRALVRGINPPVLAERGLGDAIRALALDASLATEVDVDLPGQLPPPVESAAYFAVGSASQRHQARRGAPGVHQGGAFRRRAPDRGQR